MKILTSSLKGRPNHYNTVVRNNVATVITSLANQWYRKSKTKQSHSGGVSETSTPSQFARLPQELVEMIIFCLIYDTRTLIACSKMCRSWYIATAPCLHHTLTIDHYDQTSDKRKWPRPLWESYHLDLLPLVKRFQIRLPDFCFKFTPELFEYSHTLRHFSALTNLQELRIDNLQVSAFIPNIRRYFGHLAPTLRSLVLVGPLGSIRQILYLYFVGVFPNLQDLELSYFFPSVKKGSVDDATLVPLSTPPLRGRLGLVFSENKFVTEMIAVFGGLRFRHMSLFAVDYTQLLLHACAETLETLRMRLFDPYCKVPSFKGSGRDSSSQYSTVNSQTTRWDFDLSQNKFLRTFEATTDSIIDKRPSPGSLEAAFSTITSPLPLDVVSFFTTSTALHICRHTPFFRTMPPYVTETAMFYATDNGSSSSARCTGYRSSGWCFVRKFLIAW
jgi:hypothetical protein